MKEKQNSQRDYQVINNVIITPEILVLLDDIQAGGTMGFAPDKRTLDLIDNEVANGINEEIAQAIHLLIRMSACYGLNEKEVMAILRTLSNYNETINSLKAPESIIRKHHEQREN